jgi:hypothetical protein
MKNLRQRGVLIQRHEDMYSVGIPDMSYDIPGAEGSGWIEIKRVKEWPKRDATTLKIQHYTPAQKAWIYQHGCVNNRTFLFVQVEKDHFIFDHIWALKVGNLTQAQMFQAATESWQGTINYDILLEILREGACPRLDMT